MVSLVSCIVMMSGCVVYASCLSSSCLFVMPLMFTCSMDMLVARGILIGLCGVFLGVSTSFVLRACLGVGYFVGDVVWFRTCTLALAPTCSSFATAGAFGKAGKFDTICISVMDVGPTAKKLYL